MTKPMFLIPKRLTYFTLEIYFNVVLFCSCIPYKVAGCDSGLFIVKLRCVSRWISRWIYNI